MGIGRKIVQWFEAVSTEEPGLLNRLHPQRNSIDRMLCRLVSIGVAEAHELEKRIEQVSGVGTRKAD